MVNTRPNATIDKPTKQPKPTAVEREMDALRIIVANFKTLDKAAQTRVLSYLKARFGIYLGAD